MDFNHLLFSFDGRISRKSYWIGILIIAAATIVLSLALAPLFGISFADLSFNGKVSSGRSTQAIKLDMLVKLIVLWPSLAILIKRLHDRNRSALMALGLYALFATTILMQFLGMIGTPEAPNFAYVGVLALGTVIGLMLVVELGFIKGTPGVNEYGLDPLKVIDSIDTQEK